MSSKAAAVFFALVEASALGASDDAAYPPALGCDDAMNAWCTADASCAAARVDAGCSGQFFARVDGGLAAPGDKAWRCYSVDALTSDNHGLGRLDWLLLQRGLTASGSAAELLAPPRGRDGPDGPRPGLSHWHMASSGVSGVDLMAWDPDSEAWRFVGHAGAPAYPTTSAVLASGLPGDGALRRFRAHLPLYSGVVSVTLAPASVGSVLLPSSRASASNTKAVVWYGTSIVQGTVVARPGTTFTNLLRNRLHTSVGGIGAINLRV
jgi:hypothetical protein